MPCGALCESDAIPPREQGPTLQVAPLWGLGGIRAPGSLSLPSSLGLFNAPLSQQKRPVEPLEAPLPPAAPLPPVDPLHLSQPGAARVPESGDGQLLPGWAQPQDGASSRSAIRPRTRVLGTFQLAAPQTWNPTPSLSASQAPRRAHGGGPLPRGHKKERNGGLWSRSDSHSAAETARARLIPAQPSRQRPRVVPNPTRRVPPPLFPPHDPSSVVGAFTRSRARLHGAASSCQTLRQTLGMRGS